MTTLLVEMPEDIEHAVEEAAMSQHLSPKDFVLRALIEKLSRTLKDPYLEERARRGNRKAFDAFLAQVPDVPPEECDRLN